MAKKSFIQIRLIITYNKRGVLYRKLYFDRYVSTVFMVVADVYTTLLTDRGNIAHNNYYITLFNLSALHPSGGEYCCKSFIRPKSFVIVALVQFDKTVREILSDRRRINLPVLISDHYTHSYIPRNPHVTDLSV